MAASAGVQNDWASGDTSARRSRYALGTVGVGSAPVRSGGVLDQRNQFARRPAKRSAPDLGICRAARARMHALPASENHHRVAVGKLARIALSVERAGLHAGGVMGATDRRERACARLDHFGTDRHCGVLQRPRGATGRRMGGASAMKIPLLGSPFIVDAFNLVELSDEFLAIDPRGRRAKRWREPPAWEVHFEHAMVRPDIFTPVGLVIYTSTDRIAIWLEQARVRDVPSAVVPLEVQLRAELSDGDVTPVKTFAPQVIRTGFWSQFCGLSTTQWQI